MQNITLSLSRKWILFLLLLFVLTHFTLPIQNGRFPDAEGPAGVGPLSPGVPEALSGLAPHQHGRDVVDLVGCLGAGALLWLGDAAAFAPAPAGVEDEDQAQDGQQKGDHPTLRGGVGTFGAETEKRREREERERRESKGRTY